ncbi:MAG: hypothetical protein P8Y29_02780 [Gemmatimonadota bacterium]|jgi:hypothetical protein
MTREPILILIAVLGMASCATAQQEVPPAGDAKLPADSTAAENGDRLPASGTQSASTLSWEELSVRLVGRETSQGLQIDVTTLNDEAIVLAAEDIYAHLADLKQRIPAAHGLRVEDVEEMTPLLVAFTGFEKEISFDPSRLIILSEGSTFYPLHVLPVSPNFDRRLVGLYETVYGIYLFEPGIDFFANLEFQYANLSSGASWLSLVRRVQRAKARR